MTDQRSKERARLDRQLDAMGRQAPAARPLLDVLRDNRYRLVRLPLAALLVAGSFLAVLPGFALWMMPLGLLLLAVDVPALRPPVNRGLIRLRRWWAQRRRKGRRR